jgi:VWFA-related protein
MADFSEVNGMKLLQRACAGLFLCLPVLAFTQEAAAPAAAEAQPQVAPALTQRPAPAPAAEEGRIKLDVVVTDKSGKPVPGLELKDFSLLDNKLPAQILSFHAFDGAAQKAGPPVEVVLLLDTVNQPFTAVAIERQEISRFLLQNGGRLAQPVSIMFLTNEGVKVQGRPSADGKALAARLDQAESGLRTIGRSAGLYGALERFQLSLNAVDSVIEAEAKKPGRKLLIWVGPGWPLLNGPAVEASSQGQQDLFDHIVDFSTRLRQTHAVLYSVSEGQSGPGTFTYQSFLKGVKLVKQADPPNLGLKVIATQSGGLVLTPSNDLAAEIDTCVQDASAFYTLSFDPPRADSANEYHDLKVVVDKPGLSARTNTGYYNQP